MYVLIFFICCDLNKILFPLTIIAFGIKFRFVETDIFYFSFLFSLVSILTKISSNNSVIFVKLLIYIVLNFNITHKVEFSRIALRYFYQTINTFTVFLQILYLFISSYSLYIFLNPIVLLFLFLNVYEIIIYRRVIIITVAVSIQSTITLQSLPTYPRTLYNY